MRHPATKPHKGDTFKGLLAGLVGGLVGTWAMTEYQALWSRAVDGYASPSAGGSQDAREWQERHDEGRNANEYAAQAAAHATLDRPLTREELRVGAPIMHYGFGSTMGAAYGALAEHSPSVTAGSGTVFGTAVWAGADEAVVPLLGWSRPWKYPTEAHLQAFTAHLVFGLTTELARRATRRLLA